MHLLPLNSLLLRCLIIFLYLIGPPNQGVQLEGRKIVAHKRQSPVHVINPIKGQITHHSGNFKSLRKLKFIFFKKKENKYEMKNLENVALFVVTNEFDDAILSFNVDYNRGEKGGPAGRQAEEEIEKHVEKEKSGDIPPNGDGDATPSNVTNSGEGSPPAQGDNQSDDVTLEQNGRQGEELFPLLKVNQNKRREINLKNIHNNNAVGIFFFDLKTAEAYRDDILHLFNKNLKEKKNNKLFFGSKIKLTNLKYFMELKGSHKNTIDFVLVPHYDQLQHVLKNKKVFYGTPVYYINKVTLHKSAIKKRFYELFFFDSLKKDVRVELYPNVFLTYTMDRSSEDHVSLIIQLETLDKKKYVPIFFSYEQANQFYKIFLDKYKSHFYEYCLPPARINLNSFENLLVLLKMANEEKVHPFYNIFFVPMGISPYEEKLSAQRTNVFSFYTKKLFQRINYDLFRSFRKNLNYLIADYLYD
ncbi:conserved Plasmodium protein, unknown function [Plasmodium knowlesi strain H]|uniref:Uncharacterized protein n=3 Tax=Plasmodium knowlesi TaxID=5850 RepID=A0A5K1U3Z4_PLAKH|nr:conserved Plasmodium protein, unknown function [Plasmodium knowlesi strain H]OTN68155.1 Uncharacterized protein PKNOH_S04359700 [Plasmodium knowlesi]CAA9986960.1 conserved Plasmodium protein, unknown function [Plasmodium knowlesi strain H]SBO26447.1 conserved Plasmodium protein, unknown function [Plasmodium knowlesi strain H]SBO28164.1 conserved Plasmodium protein, unknown function [Plasmodium knowlesi strain H]VVS76434.1 conserved Plasmodium protein, unknown function [Plasmodium knowlesi s|eukprot:XP_002258207.1 hypothetical protein, conserved in Plasmodium species [Plasmodium knowlesi strain H]